MLEVFYCIPSEFSKEGYATGSRRFMNDDEFIQWLSNALSRGAVLITSVHYI